MDLRLQPARFGTPLAAGPSGRRQPYVNIASNQLWRVRRRGGARNCTFLQSLVARASFIKGHLQLHGESIQGPLQNSNSLSMSSPFKKGVCKIAHQAPTALAWHQQHEQTLAFEASQSFAANNCSAPFDLLWVIQLRSRTNVELHESSHQQQQQQQHSTFFHPQGLDADHEKCQVTSSSQLCHLRLMQN